MARKQNEAEFQAGNLRHDFENALECCQDLAGIACLKTLIETVDQIPADTFDIYIELFEELPDTELHQEMLSEVGEVGGSQKRRLNLWSASSRERLAQVRNALGAGLRSRATLSAALKAETVGKA